MNARASGHGPRHAVVAGLVVAIALRRIAVDQRAAVKRVGLAADLVLHREQHLARVEIDNVLEAVFVVVDLRRQQAELLEPLIGSGEVRDVDLRMVAVIRLLGRLGLAEVPVLFLAHLHPRLAAAAVLDHGGERAHDLAVEARDALRRARPHVELDIGHAEHDAAEAALVGRVDVDAVAPGADGLHAIVAFAEVEFRSFQRLAHLAQAIEQGGAIGHDQAGDAAQHVGLPGGQVELAHADIDPHQATAGVEEGIAGEAEAGDVIMRRQVRVADADVDVPEIDDVAQILGRAIVLLVGHGVRPSGRWILRVAAPGPQRPGGLPHGRSLIRAWRCGPHCCGTPAALITLPQSARRSVTNLRVSSVSPPPTSTCSSRRRARTSGSCSAALIAALSLATIGAGVLGGALIAFQVSDTTSGKPASAMVGTSGRTSRRLSVATASTASLPFCCSSRTAENWMKLRSRWPAITSVSTPEVLPL